MMYHFWHALLGTVGNLYNYMWCEFRSTFLIKYLSNQRRGTEKSLHSTQAATEDNRLKVKYFFLNSALKQRHHHRVAFEVTSNLDPYDNIFLDNFKTNWVCIFQSYSTFTTKRRLE